MGHFQEWTIYIAQFVFHIVDKSPKFIEIKSFVILSQGVN